jgi:uncharacterized protein (TIGR02246 family)
MRSILGLLALFACALAVGSAGLQVQPGVKQNAAKADTPPKEGMKPDRSADEKAIRANVAAFVEAYNAKNAKSVAGLFTPEAQIIDKNGEAIEGREGIEKAFAEVFKDNPQKRMEVSIESLRFLGPDLAIEEGTTKETTGDNEPPEYDRYTVIHVKRDGKWLMAMARDEEGQPPSGHEQLKPLAWLVGDWVDDGGSMVVHSSCRWSEDGNFLLQEFRLQAHGENAMRVSQRIGWDPLNKHVHSWVFDSEGGYGESVWTQDGDNWLIKATGVRPDGSTASATNMLVPSGKSGYTWRSWDRVVGDELSPSSDVKVIRVPPKPQQP